MSNKAGFKANTIPGKKPVHRVPPPKVVQEGFKNFAPTVSLKEVSRLPSRGLAYPGDVQISYRPFLFGEVKQVSGSKLSTKESYEHIMAGIEAIGMDKWDLTLADVMYLGLLRKISTLGSTEIVARFRCKHCNNNTSIVFKTDDIEFNDITAPKLPIEATFSFGKMQFSPLTIGNYFQLIDKNKDKDEVALYAMQANGEFDEIYDILFNIQPHDSKILLKVDSYLFHSVKPLTKTCTAKIGTTGEKCGAKVEIELDGGQALLMPFRSDEQSIAASIRFGVES